MINRIINIVSQIMKVPVEQVTPQSCKSDFESWDSLNHLNLIMEIESEFDISVPIEEIAKIQTIQGLIELVEKFSGQARG